MKRVLASFLAVVAFTSTALAYDTFWHTAESGGAAQHHGFSADASNIVQFATFGPDIFGPIYDHVGADAQKISEALNAVVGLRKKAPQARFSGAFMHFDNLQGELDRNWKIDYLWERLLDNTKETIKAFNADGQLNEGTKKLLTLMSLGVSLHVVEDFYSHTNWIHYDWVKLGFPQQQSHWKQDYAPSWFTVRAKLGAPAIDGAENWSIEPRSGIYPPPAATAKVPKDAFGVPMTHDAFNHDNSKLFYGGVSQIPSHKFGAHPADADAGAHQLFSVSSAAMAADEWIDLLSKDAKVKAAIDGAKTWDLKKFNPAMQRDLESALAFVLTSSCLIKKWDGDDPGPVRSRQCAASQIVLPTIFNEYWGAYIKYAILEKLAKGLGDASGHYTFDKAWLTAKRGS